MASAKVNSRHTRAIAILKELGCQPFDFQASLAKRCIQAVSNKERLLVLAPTGTGKTLVGQLSIALMAQEKGDFVRVLVVIPSRPLLNQHASDAFWLRSFNVNSLNVITSDDPLPMVTALLKGPGVVYVTPMTLVNRLSMMDARDTISHFDYAIFDEIDMYLTFEMKERKDTWRAVAHCLEAGLPILGFTGTNLTQNQINRWKEYGFREVLANVPSSWMPFTKVQFDSINNPQVARLDSIISENLSQAYKRFVQAGGDASKWSYIKNAAIGSGPMAQAAKQILKLHSDRLQLFEGESDLTGKLRRVVELSLNQGPVLVLSRYRRSAQKLYLALYDKGVVATEADGSLPRSEINRITQDFRSQSSNSDTALIITRQLGGRGLDFPNAKKVVMVSPRSDYQTVAQELARIRSRKGSIKNALILYYQNTAETVKAERLSAHLRHSQFRDQPLFSISNAPKSAYSLAYFDSRHLRLEESLYSDSQM